MAMFAGTGSWSTTVAMSGSNAIPNPSMQAFPSQNVSPVADRRARETGQRGDAIRNVGSSDRLKREKIVKCKSEIGARDRERRESDVGCVHHAQGIEDLN